MNNTNNNTNNYKIAILSSDNFIKAKKTNNKRKLNTQVKEEASPKRIRYTKCTGLNLAGIQRFKRIDNNATIGSHFFEILPAEIKQMVYLELLSAFEPPREGAKALISFALSCKAAFNEIGYLIEGFFNKRNCTETRCGVHEYRKKITKNGVYKEPNSFLNALVLLKMFLNRQDMYKALLWHKHLIMHSLSLPQAQNVQINTIMFPLRSFNEGLMHTKSYANNHVNCRIAFHKSIKTLIKLARGLLNHKLECFQEAGFKLLLHILDGDYLLTRLCYIGNASFQRELETLRKSNLSILLKLCLISLSFNNKINKKYHSVFINLFLNITKEQRSISMLNETATMFSSEKISQIIATILKNTIGLTEDKAVLLSLLTSIIASQRTSKNIRNLMGPDTPFSFMPLDETLTGKIFEIAACMKPKYLTTLIDMLQDHNPYVDFRFGRNFTFQSILAILLEREDDNYREGLQQELVEYSSESEEDSESDIPSEYLIEFNS